MLKYITNILLLLLLSLPVFAQDEDSTTTEIPKISLDSLHQLRINFDISKPIINAFIKQRQAYEIEVDYYHKRDIYFVAEAGWGSADVTDSAKTLVYNTSNIFLKAGINKAMLPRMTTKDWDMLFLGARYGIGLIKRSDATYTTYDNFWGTTKGNVPGKSYTAHWAEITAGMKVELLPCFFAGYNLRARFLLNRNSFKELPPSYIAGYGKGDKGSIFDFNFYLSYAIRWKKAGTTTVATSPVIPEPATDTTRTSNMNRPLNEGRDSTKAPTKPSKDSRFNTAPVK